MNYIRRVLHTNINPAFFRLCLALPVAAFVIVLLAAGVLGQPTAGSSLSAEGMRKFLYYYDTYWFKEFTEIFGNNFLAAVIVIYFTPMALGLRSLWERLRGNSTEVSGFEKNLLYLFPGMFLVRQAVNIALASYGLASQIGRNVMITVTGIILPHGLPELLVFSAAGAVGMEVTRKALTASSRTSVNSITSGLLVSAVTICAMVEVYLTPKVFAFVMSLPGIN